MRRNVAGATLIELILVLAIIGSLIALGMPYYGGLFGDLKLSGFSRKISSDLRECHQRAINEHACFVVVRDNERQYTVYRDSACNGAVLELVKTVNLIARPPMQNPNISVSWGTAERITFTPVGTAYGETAGGQPAPMNVTITTSQGKSAGVTVASSTGHVRIQ